jgi:hypothetical protein
MRCVGLGGGKWNYFPVKTETVRIRSECEAEDHDEECALILDPTDADDVDLLYFDQFGNPKPRSTAEASWEYKRVLHSIKLLNLAHRDFVRRRAQLGRIMQALVDRGNKAHRELRAGKQSARAMLREVKAELRRMTAPSADFSRFCQITLRGYRDSEWVDELV